MKSRVILAGLLFSISSFACLVIHDDRGSVDLFLCLYEAQDELRIKNERADFRNNLSDFNDSRWSHLKYIAVKLGLRDLLPDRD